MQDTSGPNVKVSIIGGSGYTGAELLRLLLFHPLVEVVSVTSRQFEGQKVTEVFPHFSKSPYEDLIFENYYPDKVAQNSDVVFCCLPHKAAFPIVKELNEVNPKLKIIDFSADFRFKSVTKYEEVYGVKHTAKELFEKVAYGLPEINREEIKKKNIIANPGCYPTSIILGLYPAKVNNLIDPSFPIIADSKSGVTGAGRKSSLAFTYCEINESFKAYSIEGHRHAPEIAEKLDLTSIRFTPHLVPMNRGILSTIYFKTNVTKEELRRIYKEFYKNEYFIRLKNNPPKTSDVAGTNFCDIYVTKDEENNLGIVISVIDNIGKGASGQAIQNMNIICGFPEGMGLTVFSQWI
ncbi:N-acetyl-gamma-glutamyl-phosphate reductase [Desulfurobacterium thermolithotrophum DSM 11699]|uniref:N-acetyl-gamma-glutamyl-phosphate reductase n=1 Tax=Desulfurobacterium thermolithotrophum (strain DSM 11699 / BSA) TaxID=868864 RepID=F0S117_DESTD|nr:N-acetyl-gamma-glutamyl-phosphate reductase [Desulfurobacterium thermolithotrophum]ADY73895.1 N-acetyl-gamma-glutamyl-phosphate reductase [Desulfurobacterium thermolithotrophum DSM 11699]